MPLRPPLAGRRSSARVANVSLCIAHGCPSIHLQQSCKLARCCFLPSFPCSSYVPSPAWCFFLAAMPLLLLFCLAAKKGHQCPVIGSQSKVGNFLCRKNSAPCRWPPCGVRETKSFSCMS